ncbi:hypothetical protein BCE75_11234 [Isoptericola sp. CG 20/1183]|uniref:Uncharacterized protein n=1 Tax=Isoptericola halotolerans TaxID=300560 RepID=A0ABX5EAL9_9MICO|nr:MULTISPECIES: hypothetical protein [Isoptericola]PRZ03815.1 hypothetical protein BCE75_11234 [Isoptericola sp. CG 20/1183]PRZ04052.1 hypothetical protein BCL65_11186 [Isoptericola halotolerans]
MSWLAKKRRGTAVQDVPRPVRMTIFHPELGVLEVESSVPADEFEIGSVAATQGSSRRWFVGDYAGGASAIAEVREGAVVEEVTSRHRPTGFVRGYLDVEFFDDRESAEEFAAFVEGPRRPDGGGAEE